MITIARYTHPWIAIATESASGGRSIAHTYKAACADVLMLGKAAQFLDEVRIVLAVEGRPAEQDGARLTLRYGR